MNSDRVMEALFPNAETSVPPDGTGTELTGAKDTVKALLHADGTLASRHFAGALIVGAGGAHEYRKLLGCQVRVGGSGHRGASARENFAGELPPLAPAVGTKGHRLTLLPGPERKNPAYVATRFLFDGGTIVPAAPSGAKWRLVPTRDDGSSDDKAFALEAQWTIETSATELALEVSDLSGAVAFAPIVLDATHQEVYFYNFDVGLPSLSELTSEHLDRKDFLIDHDFKWLYMLLRRTNASHKHWQQWLDGEPFPAPTRPVELVTVSTCFPTVWTGQ